MSTTEPELLVEDEVEDSFELQVSERSSESFVSSAEILATALEISSIDDICLVDATTLDDDPPTDTTVSTLSS